MTTNINISPKNITGKCDLKCAYAFKYPISNSTARNDGIMINLSYENNTNPPVLYNQQKYLVNNINIVSPSIHTYNGSSCVGEIIIYHNPVQGGNILAVSIPFITSSETSYATSIITDIINLVATNAPSSGESTNLNLTNFTLQTIIPKKPYFAYTNDNTDWIVYGDLEAIPLSSSTISTLQKIIQPYYLSTPGTDLFYNPNGPNMGLSIGDGIYISCKPTGSSDEETTISYDKNTTSIDFSSIKNLFKSDTFKIIISILISIILFVLIFYGIYVFYSYLSSNKKTTT
jgi:hypothetical protein